MKQKNQIIIVGPQLSGKTTLAAHLRSKGLRNIYELEEGILKLNNDKWPNDNDYKDKVLTPKVVDEILEKKSIIFFASYIPVDQLRKARDRGFRVVKLQLGREELMERNEERMRKEKYEDASQWLDTELKYLQEIQDAGLVDQVLDATRPAEELAGELRRI